MTKGAEATTSSAPAATLEQVRARLREAEGRGDKHEAANLRLELRILADQATQVDRATR